ncbi:MAG TPA: hypothetical protein VKF59_07575 [Candidatus Dormibacteraeota bacterium]|nr:hypothetical protein [Candidatus Dormibacteraeota bacterium]
MTMDQPQEQHGEPGHPERVEGERDVGAGREAERLEEQHEEPDYPERVEDDTAGVAAQTRAHPEHVEGERDDAAAQEAERPAATPTALLPAEGAGPALIAGERLTVLEDRHTGASHTPAGMPTSAHGDFQVFGPGELDGYRSRWESIQLGFLDDPKGAAEEADTVVGELLGRLTERRQALSDELNRQSEQDVDTESMRLAVRNYRSLFRRLVGS